MSFEFLNEKECSNSEALLKDILARKIILPREIMKIFPDDRIFVLCRTCGMGQSFPDREPQGRTHKKKGIYGPTLVHKW